MPLQNRVDPSGKLHADPARGLFTGNRGVIHDPSTRMLTGRRWTTKSWIICACRYRHRRRDVWGRNARAGGIGWTELFFLDEVTALAAGHRPCFECRRDSARAYADAFGNAFGIAHAKAPDMDARLHGERMISAPNATRPEMTMDDAPDGTVFADADTFFVRMKGRTLGWGFDGYSPAGTMDTAKSLSLITPPTSVAVLAAGYRPLWHPSAG